MQTHLLRKLQVGKNFFSSLGDRDVFHIDESGERRWLAILCVACVVFLVSLALHYRLFVAVQSIEDVAAAESGKTMEQIDDKNLDRVLELYKQRAVLFEQELSATSSIVDPSR